MIIKKAGLQTVCGVKSFLPEHTEAEFAFAGKSNVGKSSLINALLNRKALARTSATPGKTQTINYYHINDEFYFVDLPGYGYTKADVSARSSWGTMVERYLKKSTSLKTVFLLTDIRHKPSADDLLMFSWITENGFEPVIVATKADKLGKNDRIKAEKLIKETFFPDGNGNMFPVSSSTRKGIDEIWNYIEKIQ